MWTAEQAVRESCMFPAESQVGLPQTHGMQSRRDPTRMRDRRYARYVNELLFSPPICNICQLRKMVLVQTSVSAIQLERPAQVPDSDRSESRTMKVAIPTAMCSIDLKG